MKNMRHQTTDIIGSARRWAEKQFRWSPIPEFIGSDSSNHSPLHRTEAFTAYILAARACGASFPYLRISNSCITAKEARRALKKHAVEIRFSIVSDPKNPDLRRQLELECRLRGETDWRYFTMLPLLNNVASGKVWRYAKVLEAGSQSARLTCIHWGSRRQDYKWAVRFLKGDLGKRPLELLHKTGD